MKLAEGKSTGPVRRVLCGVGSMGLPVGEVLFVVRGMSRLLRGSVRRSRIVFRGKVLIWWG